MFRERNWTNGKSHSLKLHSVGQRIKNGQGKAPDGSYGDNIKEPEEPMNSPIPKDKSLKF